MARIDICAIFLRFNHHRKDLMIIVAGYPEPMDKFIASNDGLKSRLKTRLDFEDYTPEEMVEIFKQTIDRSGMLLEEGVEALALSYFDIKSKENGFGNARGVRNTFEELVEKIDEYIYYYNNKRYQWNKLKMAPVEYRNHLLNVS